MKIAKLKRFVISMDNPVIRPTLFLSSDEITFITKKDTMKDTGLKTHVGCKTYKNKKDAEEKLDDLDMLLAFVECVFAIVPITRNRKMSEKRRRQAVPSYPRSYDSEQPQGW